MVRIWQQGFLKICRATVMAGFCKGLALTAGDKED